jgi:DNA-binding IclR family transcriptional regulator
MEDLSLAARRPLKEAAPEPYSTRYAVPSVDAAVRAIELIAREPLGLGLSELARQLALPKSTMRNVLLTLLARGWLEYDATARTYRIGQGFAAVARVAAPRLDPLLMIRPHLERLAALARLTCAVAERVGDGYIVQAKAESPDAVRVTVVTGEHQPWGAGALARALLSGVPDRELMDILKRAGPNRLSPACSSLAEYRNLMTRVRQLGYSVSLGEVYAGVNAVAVPVAVDGSVRFALGFLGTARALPTGRAAKLAFELGTAARELSQRLSVESRCADGAENPRLPGGFERQRGGSRPLSSN